MLSADDLKNQGNPLKAVEESAEDIKDKAKFVGEMLEVIMESKNFDGDPLPKFEGKLTDVEIDGDKATGTVVENDGDKKSPVHFVKEDGRWKIAMGPAFGP